MKTDLRIIYFYEREDGKRLQRTFAISEIKSGEDDAHLILIPGFKFIGMEAENE